jgi:hypothetical protein
MDADWADVRCTSVDEARWFRSLLEAEGIEAQIPDEHTRGLPLTDAADADSVRLLVPAADLERALELLAEADRGGATKTIGREPEDE